MLFINDDEAASLLDMESVRTVVIDALVELAGGQAATCNPPGIFIRNEAVPCSYHVKGAYLGRRSIAGFRLAGFPRGAVPTGRLQMLILTDLASSVPYAMIQSESLHPIRVGVAIALTIERLRHSGARSLALLGAGRLAHGTLKAIQAMTPFETVRVAASSLESAARFCGSAEAPRSMALVPVADAETACRDADVIVTLTSANEALVRADWCKPGNLLVSAGGRQECEEQAILQAARVFVDDWVQCSTLGDIAVLYRQGLIKENDVESLVAVSVGRIAGRADDDERIVAVPQGLAVLDIAIGHAVYEAAVARRIGVKLDWH